MNDGKGVWPPPPTHAPPVVEAGEEVRRSERTCGMASLCAGVLGAAFLFSPNVALAAHRWGMLPHVPLALLTQLTVWAGGPLLASLFTGMYGRRTLPGKLGVLLVYAAGALMLFARHAVYWPDHSGARF